MKLIRTTLRLKENLKKDAERMAIEQDLSFQEVFNRALETYLNTNKTKHTLSKDFATWVDTYIEENRPALEELSNT